MRGRIFLLLLALIPCLASSTLGGDAVLVRAGRFAPLFGSESEKKALPIQAFRVDRYPVTNARFRDFVERNPRWTRGRAPRLLADSRYLRHWGAGGKPGPEQALAPVTYVSWHAAQAYCEARGGRLPTVLEWEYVAAADEKKEDASRDPEFVARILQWYSKPQDPERLPAVGQGRPNAWGAHDLHGLVWEWTQDFNSVFVNGDNRQDGDRSSNLFCGNGATGSAGREDYAAFLRYAMRSSLSADFAQPNVGFRCVYSLEEGPEKRVQRKVSRGEN